jgi:hypothetical protein
MNTIKEIILALYVIPLWVAAYTIEFILVASEWSHKNALIASDHLSKHLKNIINNQERNT